MITPNEIKKKAEKKYNDYLQSIVDGIPFNPIVITGNKKPSEDTARFEAELVELMNHSSEMKGYGYTIAYQTVKTKRHGVQKVPTSITFITELDYLKYINKVKETQIFKSNLSTILSSFAELKDWIHKYPHKVVENDWDSLLKVCRYFRDNPKPQLYIRELPIQVHTKFIERNRGIIQEILDIILASHVNASEKRFETRFNLKFDEPIVRFRILDKTVSDQWLSGIEDLAIPISQFQQINLPIQSIFIVENKINMLTFPPMEKSIVVWGRGFGVDVMKDVEWLKTKKIYYWGDLDAHGFQILSEIRTHFSQVESFLMDRDTFDKYFEYEKGNPTKVEKELCLTPEENEMFKFLKENNYRLEQEKIPFDYILTKIPQ